MLPGMSLAYEHLSSITFRGDPAHDSLFLSHGSPQLILSRSNDYNEDLQY
jgi:hypothetical protein